MESAQIGNSAILASLKRPLPRKIQMNFTRLDTSAVDPNQGGRRLKALEPNNHRTFCTTEL